MPYTRWLSLDRLFHSANKTEAIMTRALLMQFKTFVIIFFVLVFDYLLSVTQHLSLHLHATQLDIYAFRRLSID